MKNLVIWRQASIRNVAKMNMTRSVMKFETYVKYFEAYENPETNPLFVNESTICKIPPAFEPSISLMSTSE